MIKVVAPKGRAVHLSSTTGATVHLAAGESRVVQPMFAPLAAKAGCAIQPVEGGSVPDPGPGDDERLEKLEDAVRVVVDKGDPDDFTNSGKPRKAAVQALVDFDFTTGEMGDAFDRVTRE